MPVVSVRSYLVALAALVASASGCADGPSACERLRETGEACNVTSDDACRSSAYPCGYYVSCGTTCSEVGGIGCVPAEASCPPFTEREAMRDAVLSDDEPACQAFVDQLCP